MDARPGCLAIVLALLVAIGAFVMIAPSNGSGEAIATPIAELIEPAPSPG